MSNNTTKIQSRMLLGTPDFMKYNEFMQGEFRKDNKIFSYPLVLSGSPNMLPSLVKLYETADEIKSADRFVTINEADADKKIVKNIKIEYGLGENKLVLEYNRARFFYQDPLTSMVSSIWLPLVPADETGADFLMFMSQFTEAFLDMYTFSNIMMATNKNIVDSNIRGLGFEFFERLTGSTNTDPLTQKAIIAGLEAGADRDKISEAIKEHEDSKSRALIFDWWLRKKLTQYATQTKQISKDLKEKAKLGKQAEKVVMQSSDVAPVYAKRPEPALTDVTSGQAKDYSAYSVI